MHTRAYSTFEIKSINDEERIIVGLASTPDPDRINDELDSKGAQFTLPMPFRWEHKETVGEVFKAERVTQGIQIHARIPKVTEPGRLKEITDFAWQSVKFGLARGLSIGWKPIDAQRKSDGGLRVSRWSWFETSACSIPVNAAATIQYVKSLDSAQLAALGTEPTVTQSPGVSGHVRVDVSTHPRRTMKRTTAEQIGALEAKRQASTARILEIQSKASDEGRNKDEKEKEEFDALSAEVDAIDIELKDLRAVEQMQKSMATTVPAVAATSSTAAAASRAGGYQNVQVGGPQMGPGIGMARVVLCKMKSYMEQKNGNPMSALAIAKQWYPDCTPVHQYLEKANVVAGDASTTAWAGVLNYAQNLPGDLIEYLRPQTIIGKFGRNGVPALRQVPFNIRIPRVTTGLSGSWVGEGKPKPLSAAVLDSVSLGYYKVAGIAVITQELARFSSPSAEAFVRDELTRAIVARIDTDFIDPGKAISAGVSPASITNGLTALSSAGTSADNIRTDLTKLLNQFIINKLDPSGLVLIMPNTLAMAASIMVTTNGQKAFPDLTMNGGFLNGIPVITSQYAANEATFGNIVVAVAANEIALADDGVVSIDVSGETALQMLDNPTNDVVTPTATSMVSMFQTNSLAIRAERFIAWAKLRSTAVVLMDDVNWGAVGSPV